MRLEQKPIISYFPTGTMNDFGTNFGLTNDMLQCAKIACKENIESFDVGKMNSRYFNYVAIFAHCSISLDRPKFVPKSFMVPVGK